MLTKDKEKISVQKMSFVILRKCDCEVPYFSLTEFVLFKGPN